MYFLGTVATISIYFRGCFDNLVDNAQLFLCSAVGGLRGLKDKSALPGLGGNTCLAREAVKTVPL